MFCLCCPTAPTKIYTLSYTTLFRSDDVGARLAQHPEASAIASRDDESARVEALRGELSRHRTRHPRRPDRKSTRLNSSHMSISYAVFCLKKKKQTTPRALPHLITIS